jgi:hexosaminidase
MNTDLIHLVQRAFKPVLPISNNLAISKQLLLAIEEKQNVDKKSIEALLEHHYSNSGCRISRFDSLKLL